MALSRFWETKNAVLLTAIIFSMIFDHFLIKNSPKILMKIRKTQNYHLKSITCTIKSPYSPGNIKNGKIRFCEKQKMNGLRPFLNFQDEGIGTKKEYISGVLMLRTPDMYSFVYLELNYLVKEKGEIDSVL